ncbi:MAG: hypothetical protein ABEH66_07570 [Halobacteriales archaeon]
MSVGEALRDLGSFLDECEDEGTVSRVELSDDAGAGSPLTAEIEVELRGTGSEGGSGAVSLRDASVDSGGGLVLGFESAGSVVPAEGHEVDVRVVDATLDRDGSIGVTLSASTAVEGGAPSDRTSPDHSEETGTRSNAPVDRDVPPFRDADLLEEVYASCDTFAEMTEEIGMDVTAETVRRYMIDHGIHEPNSYDTDGDPDEGVATGDRGDPEAPEIDAEDGDSAGDEPDHVVLADGIGLPENVTVETLIETVKESNTIYEVTRNIGVDRQDALEMLRELNLLDLVVGRLATEAERDITREDVVARLREASATAS